MLEPYLASPVSARKARTAFALVRGVADGVGNQVVKRPNTCEHLPAATRIACLRMQNLDECMDMPYKKTRRTAQDQTESAVLRIGSILFNPYIVDLGSVSDRVPACHGTYNKVFSVSGRVRVCPQNNFVTPQAFGIVLVENWY